MKLSKIEIKKQLKDLGIRVEGEYLRKKDIEKVLSAWKEPKIREIQSLLEKSQKIKLHAKHLSEDNNFDEKIRLRWDKLVKYMDNVIKNLISAEETMKTMKQ